MKRYFAMMCLFFFALLTGCVTEDWDLCDDDENCMLRFRYPDESGIDIFTKKINSVDLLIFDENLHYLSTVRAEKEYLDEFRGISLYLKPGDYNIVCWGNVNREQEVKNLPDLQDCILEIEDGNGGMPLYYAPSPRVVTSNVFTGTMTSLDQLTRARDDLSFYRVVVPKKGVVERDIEFVRAHRTIEVYVKGYQNTDPEEPQMQVEITHLAYAYDFLLQVAPLRKSHFSIAKPYETPEGVLPGTKVNTPYQEIEEDIYIHVTTTTGKEVSPRINLKTYLERAGIPLDALSLHEIKILITLKEGEVYITLPTWDDNEVNPEI